MREIKRNKFLEKLIWISVKQTFVTKLISLFPSSILNIDNQSSTLKCHSLYWKARSLFAFSCGKMDLVLLGRWLRCCMLELRFANCHLAFSGWLWQVVTCGGSFTFSITNGIGCLVFLLLKSGGYQTLFCWFSVFFCVFWPRFAQFVFFFENLLLFFLSIFFFYLKRVIFYEFNPLFEFLRSRQYAYNR